MKAQSADREPLRCSRDVQCDGRKRGQHQSHSHNQVRMLTQRQLQIGQRKRLRLAHKGGSFFDETTDEMRRDETVLWADRRRATVEHGEPVVAHRQTRLRRAEPSRASFDLLEQKSPLSSFSFLLPKPRKELSKVAYKSRPTLYQHRTYIQYSTVECTTCTLMCLVIMY